MSVVYNNCVKNVLATLNMLRIVEALATQVIGHRHDNYSTFRQEVLPYFGEYLLFESCKLLHNLELLIYQLDVVLDGLDKNAPLLLFKLLLNFDWHYF